MKQNIERINKRTTEYTHPSQATTTANALDLLSSGIYTEEERFIFELLQNAVDSFNMKQQSELLIKIVITDNLLVFMHNGIQFSERDLEGLCDIGNGNKMTDAKKIGYKGIGFKSVFMHSHRVTVLTDRTCFKFDKEACDTIARSKGVEYENVKMPWQIIPILTHAPSDINTEGFNVITYIDTSNRKSLKRKVERLLTDTRFLLFLKVDDIRISFWDEEGEIMNLSKKQTSDMLTLSKNEESQSSWLIYSEEVKLTPEVRDALLHDSKTPTKLKESESVEISFAIALDEDKNIIPIKNAMMYTYLPTSFSFGLDFIVNANFITDAGRQQIVKDCAWNKFIFSQIPEKYLNWIANNVVKRHPNWYKVLPTHANNDDELSEVYEKALTNALDTIPFVMTIENKMVLLKEVLMDNVKLNSAIPNKTFDIFVQTEVSKNTSSSSLVSSEVGEKLQEIYEITSISTNYVNVILEKANEYLKGFSDKDYLTFLNWLRCFSLNYGNDFKRMFSYMSILPDDDNNLIEPVNSFIPSNYSDENPDVSTDAKIIRKSLIEHFSNEIEDWLKELGVQEMSNLSVIEKVLCDVDYINKENAVDVLRFIFECNKKESVFTNISINILGNLKVLTTSGTLKNASELYLSNKYNPICKIQDTYLEDIFVSEKYPKNELEYAEWSLFLKKLGCNDDIILSQIKYGNDSWLMRNPIIQNCVQTARQQEYNKAQNGRQYYLGSAGGVCVYAMSSPLLTGSTSNQQYEFYINFWGRIFSNIIPDKSQEYVFGNTGYGYTKKAFLSDPSYLGKSFIEWFVSSKKVIPASDGYLYSINNVLINNEYNTKTFGPYFPVLAINETLSDEWMKKLPLKKELSLTEYLGILDRISKDDTKEDVSANKEKINRIYEYIADSFDFSEGNSNFKLVQNWGSFHKILSKEETFESPNSLYLLSSRLSGVELDQQAFHGKHLENERFALFMIAMGVNMIDNHRVEGLNDAILKPEIKTILYNKASFLTAIVAGDSPSKDSWDNIKSKTKNSINKLEFLQASAISIYYGDQEFSRTTYVQGSKFYFVGKFGLANQELLHGAIMEALDLPKKARTLFLTILQMTDFTEIKEYIEQKGYETKFIENAELSSIKDSALASIGISNNLMTGLGEEEMKSYLFEAKDAILEALESSGYDTRNAVWDKWTCIDGVTKNDVEYPLVVRSNRSGSSTKINASDWNQLMKPNAMFAVLTSDGVGTMDLHEMLKSKENITIKFSSSNIDKVHHINEIAHIFAYFNGLQIDFQSFIPAAIGSWKRFTAPENNTGELPQSTNISLPD